MGRHARAELLHLVFSLILTTVLFEAAAWAYPIGAGTIRIVGGCVSAAVLVMAAGPFARARREDRGPPTLTGVDHG